MEVQTTEIRRNPRFQPARIVLFEQLRNDDLNNQRVRIAGILESASDTQLVLSQDSIRISINIMGSYCNLHEHYRFVEVYGLLHNSDKNNIIIDGYYFRGLNHFNMQLYQKAVQKRDLFLNSME